MKKSELRKLIREEIHNFMTIFESKSYKTKLGRMTPSKKMDAIYLDQYDELDQKLFKKFEKAIIDKFEDAHVLKTSDITVIKIEDEFDWSDIEDLLKKL